MDEKLEGAYSTIARHIDAKEEQCVLILGPELAVNKSGENYKSIFKNIIPADSKSFYFSAENLFHFNDRSDRKMILEKLIRFYKEVGDNKLLELIATIKFPLIINVSPDKSINIVYKRLQIDYESGYLSKTNAQDFTDLPVPSKDKPVIYNILGSIDLDSSLVLDHHKLFNTIEYLFSNDSLPKNIKRYLNRAESFIFLGFKFDSWYYQLLCHKLGIKSDSGEPKNNICSSSYNEDENVKIIIENSFDIKPTTDNPIECIQNIIHACTEEFPRCLREIKKDSSFGVWVSYAHNDEENPKREIIVNLIENELKHQKHNIFHFIRDHNDLHYGDKIDEFMTSIGKGKTVIQIISDKYLKSPYCMIEAFKIYKDSDRDKRVFTIVLDDTTNDRLKIDVDTYLNFWQEIFIGEIKKPPSDFKKAKVKEYEHIYHFIEEFIREINEEVYLKIKYSDLLIGNEDQTYNIRDERKGEFEKFLKTVLKK